MRTLVLAVFVACKQSTSVVAPTEAAPSAVPQPTASSTRRFGQPFFLDGGGQAVDCEEASPPMPLEPKSSSTACWYAGTSCAGHGAQIDAPFGVAGNVVSGDTVHGGCDVGHYALVWERGTSPLRVRVCVTRPAPMDCPASVHDGARWNVSALLETNHATSVVLVSTP